MSPSKTSSLSSRQTQFISAIQSCLDEKSLCLDENEFAPHLIDSRGVYKGKAFALLRPKDRDEVSRIMTIAYQHDIPITPQGGNTGRVAGAIPDETGDSIIIELGRMNQIRKIDLVNNVVCVESGVILKTLQDKAKAHDRYFPLSLGSQGSCMIGGNIASNAGGVHVLRYGNMRDLVLGIEAVLPDGRIFEGLRSLRKNNMGYDLKHLLIASEGTLGIITAANLKLFPLPKSYQTAFIRLSSLSSINDILNKINESYGDVINACELIPDTGLGLVKKHLPHVKQPFSLKDTTDGEGWSVLLELATPSAEYDIEKAMMSLLTSFDDAIEQAVLAKNERERLHFWHIREAIVEAERLEGRAIKHDISLPLNELADFIELMEKRLRNENKDIGLCVFGHIGDGNLHYNILPPVGANHNILPPAGANHNILPPAGANSNFFANEKQYTSLIYQEVIKRGGSISAEHGVGQVKQNEISDCMGDVELAIMRQIKSVFDPKGLMNPNKLLPNK